MEAVGTRVRLEMQAQAPSTSQPTTQGTGTAAAQPASLASETAVTQPLSQDGAVQDSGATAGAGE